MATAQRRAGGSALGAGRGKTRCCPVCELSSAQKLVKGNDSYEHSAFYVTTGGHDRQVACRAPRPMDYPDLFKAITFGHDDDTVIREGETLAVPVAVITNPFIGRDTNMFVDDAAFDYSAFADMHAFKQDAVLDL